MASKPSEVDEWEVAELNIQNLAVETSKLPGPPTLTIPKCIDQNDSSSFTAIPRHSTQESTQPPISTADDPIDSAIMSAINNPRERMILFQIEDTLLQFVKSNEPSLEIPPIYNSFRRLLAYRVGQRFGLTHTSVDLNAENGERTITLFRSAVTAIPKVLLIDMPSKMPPVEVPKAESSGGMPGFTNYGSGAYYGQQSSVREKNEDISANTPPPSSATATDMRKVSVMKRNPKKVHEPKPAGVRVKVSTEEKERAYNEARARIFGADAGAGSNADSATSSNASSGCATPTLLGTAVTEGGSTSATSTAPTSARSSAHPTPAGRGGDRTSKDSGSMVKSTSSSALSDSSVVAHKDPSHLNSSGNDARDAHVKRVTSYPSLPTENKGGVAENAAGGYSSRDGGRDNRRQQSMKVMPRRPPSSHGSSSSNNSGGGHYGGDGNNNSRGGGGGGKKGVVNTSSWRENKSQVRDIDAERSDPDFARQAAPTIIPIVPTANMGMMSYGGMSSPTHYSNAPPAPAYTYQESAYPPMPPAGYMAAPAPNPMANANIRYMAAPPQAAPAPMYAPNMMAPAPPMQTGYGYSAPAAPQMMRIAPTMSGMSAANPYYPAPPAQMTAAPQVWNVGQTPLYPAFVPQPQAMAPMQPEQMGYVSPIMVQMPMAGNMGPPAVTSPSRNSNNNSRNKGSYSEK